MSDRVMYHNCSGWGGKYQMCGAFETTGDLVSPCLLLLVSVTLATSCLVPTLSADCVAFPPVCVRVQVLLSRAVCRFYRTQSALVKHRRHKWVTVSPPVSLHTCLASGITVEVSFVVVVYLLF